MNRIRVFRAVVASGSVAAAAKHLGYTPSAVSQQLTALQRETRLNLFERDGRGISPTREGLELASRSEEVMGSLARLDYAIADLREGRTETLSVSSFASAAEELMPGVAATVLSEFPEVTFTFQLNETQSTLLAAPDIDICTEEVDGDPLSREGYERFALAEDPYLAVLPPDHPRGLDHEVRFADLADEAWVDNGPVDSICGQIMTRATRSAGIRPRFVAYAGDHHGALAFIAAGIGVSVMPRLATLSHPPGVIVRPLVAPAVTRRIVAMVRTEALLKPVGRRVVQLLTERCAQLG